MATYNLTTGIDIVAGTSGDDIVYALYGDIQTLNAGDRLTGGEGNDTLSLIFQASPKGGASGATVAVNIDTIAVFESFEKIILNGSNGISIRLGTQNLVVHDEITSTFIKSEIFLGGGATTIYSGAYQDHLSEIFSTASSRWNGLDVFDGSAYAKAFQNQTNLSVALFQGMSSDSSYYDLTGNTFRDVTRVYSAMDGGTLKINSANAAGVAQFSGRGGFDQHLTTADTELDLSHTTVEFFQIASTNSSGTRFTVKDVDTSLQIAGGAGQDTIVATGFDFTQDQRTEIFGTKSIETIIDSTGTYSQHSTNDGPYITGSANSDVLKGTAANDTLFGFEGNDQLDGKGGADKMFGGLGNDTYFVDNAADLVIENTDEGNDSVNASVTFTLAANVENLQLSGTSKIGGTGNALANDVNGNEAGNVLSGLDGRDALRGNGGNDTLDGGTGDDYLSGGAGADILIGGTGGDAMYGGAGADTFRFASLADFGPATHPDTIGDFNANEGDIIDLLGVDADIRDGFAGDQAFTFIGSDKFSHSAGELRASGSGGYLTVSGDVNGDGQADFAFIVKAAVLHHSDFLM